MDTLEDFASLLCSLVMFFRAEVLRSAFERFVFVLTGWGMGLRHLSARLHPFWLGAPTGTQ